MSTQISSLSTLANNENNYNSFIPLVDPTLSLDSRNEKIRISTHNQLFSNNFSVIGLGSYGNYFGTGIDGNLTISSSTTQITRSFSSNFDGDFLVKNFKSLTINAGVTVTTTNRCKGLIIYCTGDFVNNGTITMTDKAGGVGNRLSPTAAASSFNPLLIDASLYFNNLSSSNTGVITHWNWAPSGSVWFNNYKIRVPLSGSAVGGGPSSTGTAGIYTGGGGGGGGNGVAPNGNGGTGGTGTLFGGGGGGSGWASGATAGRYEVGGSPASGIGGGAGAGNPAGVNAPTTAQTGTGGLLIIIVRGSFTNNGTISSVGRNGAAGSAFPAPAGGAGGGGGGSGGGRVVIIYGGTYTNSGTITLSGGTGGPSAGNPGQGATGAGGAGGAGSVTVKKVHI